MQKRANRILSMLLVLVMVLSMLPATVFATGETANALKGWNIILGDDIGVKFTLNSADYTVITTVNGAEVTPTISGETVTVNVAAAQMTDTIGLTVKNGEETVHTGEYSVRKYADTILSGSYDAEVKDMVKQMLNYGAAAQTYFSYNNEEGKLANSGITVDEATVPTEVPAITVEDKLAGISLYGMSLVFRNKIAVRFYFDVTGDIDDFTFSQGAPVEKEGRYYVEVAGINPQDLDKDITLSVNDGALSVTYSPMTYIVRQYNSEKSAAALKSLVQAMYGYHQEAVAYQKYLEIVKIDTLVEHPDSNNNWTSGGIYMATQEPNDAPYKSDWTLEYAPTSSSVIKRIRNGETIDVAIAGRGTIVKYDADKYYLNVNSWTMGENAPAMDGDIYIIEGDFYNAANDATIRFAKNYIYLNGTNAEFSKEMPTLPTTVEGGVMMKVDGYGWTGGTGDLIFKMDNTAPNGGYKPTSASNIKLIRNGETYDIAYVGQNVINKDNDGWYSIPFWTIVNYKPMLANDILVIEGDFYQESTKTTLNVSKTYVLLNEDGSAEFSTEMPTLPTTVEGGVMMKVDGYGWTGPEGDLIFKMDNTAPNGGYKPTSAGNIKLIRNGETYDIAYVGENVINKDNDGWYNIPFWTIVNYKPMLANDILVIEGDFYQESTKTTLNVSKTYVLLKDGGAAEFFTEMPSQETVVDCGVMSEHAEGNASEIYFTLAENIVPVDEELLYPYAGSVQLVKGSNTSSVNVNIYKLDVDMYYLELDGAELTDGSYLIVEGAFANDDNGYIMNISKTYVLADGDALVYSETEPVLETEYALTGLTNHPNGWNADGIYITHDAHNATYNSDWSVEYKPVSAEVIKLIRNGQTYNIGQPVSGTLVVYDSAKMLFKTAAWTIQGGVLPFVDGDQIIIEGKFKHEGSGNVLVAEKTVICVSGSNLIFNPIEAGNLDNHSNGMNSNGEGIYATMAPNAAPAGVEYAPMSADAYYVIRGEEIINIGMLNRGTLVKHNDTQYYLKIKAWCTDNFAYTTDDIIVIDGYWKQNTGGNAVMKIEKTYLYHDGSKWVFSTTEPVPSIKGGMMSEVNGAGWTSDQSNGNGSLIFQMNNTAPNGDYQPTSASNVKLIRDGQTYDVGYVGQDVINKSNDTWYAVAFWTIVDYKPIRANDILIVEGLFKHKDSGTMLNITKTYVLLNADGTATFSDTEPVIGPESNHGMMNVTNWQKPALNPEGSTNDGGLYFNMAENDVAYTTDWNTQYKPVSADVIKLIRGGVETNVANTGAGMIIKYSATDYYLQFWPITQKPMQAGDIMIVEGKFKNDANGSVLNIAKTYIVFNENGTVSVYENSPMTIDAGAMSAYAAQNWFDTNYDALYFVLSSNIAPANTDWSVRYTPKDAANIKLVRNGETITIGNTDAETIVKIDDTLYALALDNWWWDAYAPIQDGDALIIEGEFTNATNGYTLKIDKTYISLVSKVNDEVIFSVPADTEYGEVLLPTSGDTLNIGMWNGSYHHFTDERLQELKDAGITKIMGIREIYVGGENNGSMTVLLDRCQKYGISVIADVRNYTADGALIGPWDGVTVPDYADHPALLGFLVCDEPQVDEMSTLQNLKNKFDQLMPAGKLFYVNLLPASSGEFGKVDYEDKYLNAYLSQVDPDVLSWDSYALISNANDTSAKGIRTGYYRNFELMAQNASKDMPLWYTMLSAGHMSGAANTVYNTPTAEELRWQMAVAMTYGVQNIDHYIYYTPAEDYTCMLAAVKDSNGNVTGFKTTDLYDRIKTVDNEYLAWDHIFMAYDWVGTAGVKASYSSTMLDMLENNIALTENGLKSVATSADVLVGVFNHNGDKAYMITNAGSASTSWIGGNVGDGKKFTMTDATVTLTLDAADYKCAAIIDQGEITYVAVENNTVTLNVEAYEGVFVIPVLN